MIKISKIVAVYVKEAKKFGCPYCGYYSGYCVASGPSDNILRCTDQECGKIYITLVKGIIKSTFGFNIDDNKGFSTITIVGVSEGDFYPVLQKHPRDGIPAHGRPNRRSRAKNWLMSPFRYLYLLYLFLRV